MHLQRASRAPSPAAAPAPNAACDRHVCNLPTPGVTRVQRRRAQELPGARRKDGERVPRCRIGSARARTRANTEPQDFALGKGSAPPHVERLATQCFRSTVTLSFRQTPPTQRDAAPRSIRSAIPAPRSGRPPRGNPAGARACCHFGRRSPLLSTRQHARVARRVCRVLRRPRGRPNRHGSAVASAERRPFPHWRRPGRLDRSPLGKPALAHAAGRHDPGPPHPLRGRVGLQLAAPGKLPNSTLAPPPPPPTARSTLGATTRTSMRSTPRTARSAGSTLRSARSRGGRRSRPTASSTAARGTGTSTPSRRRAGRSGGASRRATSSPPRPPSRQTACRYTLGRGTTTSTRSGGRTGRSGGASRRGASSTARRRSCRTAARSSSGAQTTACTASRATGRRCGAT